MIKMIIDDFKVPIIKKGVSSVLSLKNEFNSWRRSKTISRQWNLICS